MTTYYKRIPRGNFEVEDFEIERTNPKNGFGYEIYVTLVGDVEFGYEGRTSGAPENCYEGCGDAVEATAYMLTRHGAWVEVTLSEKEQEEANEAILKEAQDSADSAMEDLAYDRYYDCQSRWDY